MLAQPSLQEPIYIVDVQCPREVASKVYSVFTRRRGHVFEENQQPGIPLCSLKGYLPVADSFGFTELLRENTGGQAFPQMLFDHWEIMKGDASEPGKVRDTCIGIRKRKGLAMDIPTADSFTDKL
ncbi:Elongation factor 2 [Coemansia sp. RSA 1694]|nr:Elongation factor 2 [Coemansia sp. RSA 1694]